MKIEFESLEAAIYNNVKTRTWDTPITYDELLSLLYSAERFQIEEKKEK